MPRPKKIAVTATEKKKPGRKPKNPSISKASSKAKKPAAKAIATTNNSLAKAEAAITKVENAIANQKLTVQKAKERLAKSKPRSAAKAKTKEKVNEVTTKLADLRRARNDAIIVLKTAKIESKLESVEAALIESREKFALKLAEKREVDRQKAVNQFLANWNKARDKKDKDSLARLDASLAKKLRAEKGKARLNVAKLTTPKSKAPAKKKSG